jgi:hypothetical protein
MRGGRRTDLGRPVARSGGVSHQIHLAGAVRIVQVNGENVKRAVDVIVVEFLVGLGIAKHQPDARRRCDGSTVLSHCSCLSVCIVGASGASYLVAESAHPGADRLLLDAQAGARVRAGEVHLRERRPTCRSNPSSCLEWALKDLAFVSAAVASPGHAGTGEYTCPELRMSHLRWKGYDHRRPETLIYGVHGWFRGRMTAACSTRRE